MVCKAAITLAVASYASAAAAATIDKRITGGQDAELGEFPFIVSITGSNGHCGGTLLDSTTVLTAAHCIEGSSSVKAGSLDRKTGGVDAPVASRKPHPGYRLNKPRGGEGRAPDYAINDIGILKLSTPIEQSGAIGYATLPANGSDPVVNSIAITAGWGLQKPKLIPGGNPVNRLRKVDIPIHAREDCSKLDIGAAGRDTIVCAGGEGKNTCKHDSGGPLIDQETREVIGVVSWGIKDEGQYYCNLAPAVYTRVGSYIPFIKENLGPSGSGSGPAADSQTTTIETSEQSTQPSKSVDQQLQDYCARLGNKNACLSAAHRCTGQVKPDAAVEEFLQCVDVMQVCADQGDLHRLDQCIDNARRCKEQEKLSLGDLPKLAECAKENL
ncbi:Trypsin [Metarhizium anisopliae]